MIDQENLTSLRCRYVQTGQYKRECREYEKTGKPFFPDMPVPKWLQVQE